MVRPGLRALAIALATAVLAGACGQPEMSTNDFASGAGTTGQNCWSPEVQGTNPLPSPPPQAALPADVVLTLATRCVFGTERVPGDGEWQTREDQQATTGLDALATALRLPTKTRQANISCDLMLYAQPELIVTDTQGRQWHPLIPQTDCSAPRKEVTDAIAALTWTTTATTRLRQNRTELEVTSGCTGGYKPIIAILGVGAADRARQINAVDTAPQVLRVCRFSLSTTDTITADNVVFHMGVLASASTLDAQTSHTLLTAINAAAPAQPCTQEAPFAEISGTGVEVTVELGGCYRALIGAENYPRQLDAATVAPLLA